MAAPKTRTAAQRTARLAVVARLYRAGLTQAEIAAHPDVVVSQQQISYDLRDLIAEWRTSALSDLDTVKAQELARIDLLEREALAEYERSKRPIKKSQVVTEAAKPADTDVEDLLPGKIVRTTETTEGRLGDPRYLERVSWCIEQRLKIFGLYAPTGVALSGKDGGPLTIQVVYADPDSDPAAAPSGPAPDRRPDPAL